MSSLKKYASHAKSFTFSRQVSLSESKKKETKQEQSQHRYKYSLSKVSWFKWFLYSFLLLWFIGVQLFLFLYVWRDMMNTRENNFILGIGDPLVRSLRTQANQHVIQTETLAYMNGANVNLEGVENILTPEQFLDLQVNISNAGRETFFNLTDLMKNQISGSKTLGVRQKVVGSEERKLYEAITGKYWKSEADRLNITDSTFYPEFPIVGYDNKKDQFRAIDSEWYFPKLYKNPHPKPNHYTVNSDGLQIGENNKIQLEKCLTDQETVWGARKVSGSSGTFSYMLLSPGPNALGLTIFDLAGLFESTFKDIKTIQNGVRVFVYDLDDNMDDSKHEDHIYLGSYFNVNNGSRSGPDTDVGGCALYDFAQTVNDSREKDVIEKLSVEVPYEATISGDISGLDPLVAEYFYEQKLLPTSHDNILIQEYNVTLNNRVWKLVITADETYAPMDKTPIIVISFIFTGLFVFLFVLIIVFEAYMNQSKSRLKEAEKVAHEMLLGYLCHELRNPLHTIRMLARDIECKNTDSAESLDYLMNSADHMNDVLNAFLDMTKFNNSGKIEPTYMPNDIPGICRDIVHQYRAMDRLTAKDVEYEIIYGSDYLMRNMFLIDRMRLNQILRNALSNASKHTTNGVITLSLNTSSVLDDRSDSQKGHESSPEHAGLFIEFIIRDTGHGIGDTDPEVFFDEFTSSDKPNTSSNNVASTGLGLPMTRKIANAMNGITYLRNRNDGVTGCEFVLRIPCLKAEKSVIPSFVAKNDNMPKDTPSFTKIKVYACEDDPTSAAVLRRLLGKLAIEEIELFADGVDMINHIKSTGDSQPNIVFLDRHMKFSQGDDICAKLRTEHFFTCPIVAMTGSHITEAHSYDAVLLKPFSLQELSFTIADQMMKVKHGKCNIVACEDESVHALILKRTLESQHYSNITILEDGLDILDYMKEVSDGKKPVPDLIIMDIVMKKSRGDNICKMLRDQQVDIPILALTGNSSPNDIENYRMVGFDDVVGKPFEKGALLTSINNLLSSSFDRSTRSNSSDSIDIGNMYTSSDISNV